MNFLQRILLTTAMAASALGLWAVTANATERATVTASVNLRAGPGSKFESLGVVPSGATVTVYSCQSGFAWCNVAHGGKRGYLAGRYLTYAVQGEYYGDSLYSVGIYLGLPIFWDDYPVYRPPGNRPPDYRPPGTRPPGNRPPGWRPPGQPPPGVRPPRPSHPIYHPPSFSRPSVGGGFGGGRGGFGGGGGRGGGRR